MTLLIIILLATVSLSFLCSVMEATMLSTSTSYAETLAAKSSGGRLLKNLKQHTEKATTSILIFNTVANTTGAAGVGAQVTEVFGSEFFGVASAVMTVMIA